MRWVNDREVMQYFANHQTDITEEQERKYLETLIASKNDFVFSIFDGEEYIGQCSLNAVYWAARNARMFIVILKEHQGKGYGPQAIRSLFTIALSMKLHKVWVIVRETNRDSQAMYLKLGFSFEGVLKDEYCVNGQYFDMVRMAFVSGITYYGNGELELNR
jgi:RimJ/RimL family protein N-acetyltransferase